MAKRKLTPAQVERIGIQLFGAEHWPQHMARAYGVTAQTMRNWQRDGAPRDRFLSLARDCCADMMRNAAKALDMIDKLES